MTINENKMLSRNRKRRIDRRNKISYVMKLIIKKLNQKRKRKIKRKI